MKKTILSILIILTVINATPAQDIARKGKKFLYIGDSITDGNWGGGDAKPSSERNHWDQNHIFGSGYMYLCAAYFMGTFPEQGYVFYNRGISGNSLDDLEKRWKDDALEINPDILSILIGTNDIARYLSNGTNKDFDLAGWDTKYRNLLDLSLEKNPNLKIVLCTPFAYETDNLNKQGAWNLRHQLLGECSEIIEKIASDYNAVLVPFDKLYGDLLVRYPNVPATYWLWDGIHPTAAAHKRMADMWIEKTAGLF